MARSVGEEIIEAAINNTSDGVTFENTKYPDIIELKDICQTYDGGKNYTIKNCNLLIENKPDQGQFVVLLGMSGCGKSTLLKYIAGLQQPTSGQVLIGGKLRSDKDIVSMVFQQYSSFPWLSVLKNVMLPLELKGVSSKECRDKAMEMLKLVGLVEHKDKYAMYGPLSGGQLQRVAIARSLVSNPNIILMDEPFGALDGVTRYQMQVLLSKIWEALKSTIIFVTHDIREAVFLGDDIYIMAPHGGKILKHFFVNLPLHRDLDIMQDPIFIETVRQIDIEMRSAAEKYLK